MALIYIAGGFAFAVMETREEILERMGKGPSLVVTRLHKDFAGENSLINVFPKYVMAVADSGNGTTKAIS